MKIAVCDDEKEVRDAVRKYILRLYPGDEITLFGGGSELLGAREEFGVIFLDIKMNGGSGMETARKLRKKGCGAAIIFITALPEYVYQAFDVGAFHYLLKPIDKAKFYEVLRCAREQSRSPLHGEKGSSILVKTGRDREKIFFRDIIYAEVFDRKIVIHTTSGDIGYYGRLGELEKQAGSDFFRPHRAYLINLGYVSKYNSQEIFLDKGRALISKQKYPEFVKKYLSYIKEKQNG